MAARGVLRTAEGGHFLFRCPGCAESHMIRARKPGETRGWDFNGNYDRPTFSPSVLCRGIRSPSGADEMTEAESSEYDAIFAKGGSEAVLSSRFGSRCHSFVRDGQIQFLSDCTHALAGQTVPLAPFDGYL